MIALIAFRVYEVEIDDSVYNWVIGALLVVTVLFWRDPLPFAAIIAFVLLGNHYMIETGSATAVRSFFGVLKITDTSDGRFRTLSHGTTLHGGQRIRDDDGNPITGRPQPIMYYYDGSGIAQVLDAARARASRPIRFAVIGLGTGSLACRAEPDDTVHYYEIDRAIIRIARDPNFFSFISRVPAGRADHARRRAADARRRARRQLRRHHRRCLLVRRDPDPPDHARGDGDLQGQAHAQRHRRRAHIEPPPRARLRRRRHRQRQRPGGAHQ